MYMYYILAMDNMHFATPSMGLLNLENDNWILLFSLRSGAISRGLQSHQMKNNLHFDNKIFNSW